MREITKEEREKLEKLASELNAYEAQAEVLRQQISALSRTISEHLTTLDALKTLKNVSPETEVLVPLGSGCFVHARLKGNNKVVYTVGAGVMFEKSFDEVISLVEEKVKNLQEAIQKTQKELERVGSRAEEIRPQLEELLRKARG